MKRDDGEWERVSELFHSLVGQTQAERNILLDELKTSDPSKYSLLKTLLIADQEPHSIFENSPDQLIEEWSNDPELVGSKIGAFQLDEIVGQGAMGSVFKARRADGQFEQTVAIKLLKSQMLNSNNREFFERERQILAKLNHPGIARLYDGGFVQDGRPFFTMEWISGHSLTTYAKLNNCNLQERIELFLQVCEAVRYAHQSLVVHLDLKPANIIVNEAGQVKLLDFGVSRLLGDQLNDQGSFTLAYASPEQIKREDTSTVSDIYSLGVILFELLCGKHPFEENFQDLKLLKENELKGNSGEFALQSPFDKVNFGDDLRLICVKAMNIDASKRYTSVDEFVGDLTSFEGDFPISVRERDWSYVGEKYFRRNRNVLTAISGALILLIGTGVFYTVQLQEQRNIAQEEAERAEKITELMTDVFMAADPNVGGADTITAVNLLNTGVEDIRKNLKDNPKLYADMLGRMIPIFYNLGSYEKGQNLAKEAYQINLEEGVDANALNISLMMVGQSYYYFGDMDTAAHITQTSVENLLNSEETKPMSLAHALTEYANTVYELDDYVLSDSLYKQAYEIYLEFSEKPNKDLAFTTHMIGANARGLGDFNLAEAKLLESLQMKEELFDAPHLEIAYTYNFLGSLYMDKKDYEKAQTYIEMSLEQRQAILGNYHMETMASMANLGRVYNRMKQYENAINQYKTSLLVVDSLLGKNHYYYAGIVGNMGNSEMLAGKYDSARIHMLEAQRLYRELLPENHQLHANPYIALAKLSEKEDKPEEAKELFEKGLEIRIATLPEGHFQIAQSQQALGECLLTLGDYSTAIEYLELAHQNFQENEGFDEELLAIKKSLVESYVAVENNEKADYYQSLLSSLE